MKKIFLISAALLLFSLAACVSVSPLQTAGQSPSPARTFSLPPTTAPLPEGYIPDVKITCDYTPNSGSDLYEDEDYIIYRNLNGILIYEKSRNEILTVLPRTKAFTYYDKKVYYIGYDAETGKRNITEYSVSSGNQKMIIQMDNTATSMLAYGGRLYFAYQTDMKDITATELRSVVLDGGDMRIIGAQGIDHFVINGDSVYYTKVYRDQDFIPYLYKLSLKDGSIVTISDELSGPYRFEMSGDTLLYHSGGFFIGIYDTQTGRTSFTHDIADWRAGDSDFTILGQYIIVTGAGIFVDDRSVRAYDLTLNKMYELTELDFEQYDLYATKDGVYISLNKWDGTCLLYKVEISNGKASLKEAINYSPDKKPSSDTVIIASSGGGIRGGYSEGKWLTHSEAAAYCKGKMTFGKYNLVDLKGTVGSSGVTSDYEYEPCIASHTYLMPPETDDENAYFSLNIPEGNYTEFHYSKDPLCSSGLYYGGKLPEIETVPVTSKLKRAVQNLIDEKLGKGNAKAKIRAAVSVDVDGDEEKETVVNADNCAEEYFDSEGNDEDASKKYWYCLSCVIESDGKVKVIADYYFVPTPDNEYAFEDPYVYYEDAQFMYVQNIIDIDGDGLCELILDFSAWEDSETIVYKYDGSNVGEIMWFAVWE